ncbi:MAG: hypothetical protein ACJAT7_001290 [Psychromonas sp.]|uniref:hypothetical protein n=1 Tax=Psychromonas sp. TaxID=1884585 RepID=UPI0039E671DA
MNLKNQKILFIAPLFNGYEKHIKSAIEEQGGIVDFYPEKNKSRFLSLLQLVAPAVCVYLHKRHLQALIESVEQDYDILLIIKGEFLNTKFFECLLNKIRIKNKVLYQWDSVLNNPNTLVIQQYFDSVFTFDRDDANKYGFIYHPLFYIDLFERKANTTIEFDFFFIGVFHGDRHKELSKIKEYAKENNMTCYFKLYISLFNYLKCKLFDNDFAGVTLSDVIFKGVSILEVAELLHKSRFVVDIAHKQQSGLTIRTFEALGAGKKLITNNKNIKKEKFYDANNVFFLDELNTLEDFPSPTASSSIQNHTVKSWVNELFSG